MLINDLLKKLKDIEEQEKELKNQKKTLIKQAKNERVLEVNFIDLAHELYKISKPEKCNLFFNPICIPEYVKQDMNKAIEFIKNNNMGFGFGIIFDDIIKFRFTMHLSEIKLKTGEDLINNLEFISPTQLYPSFDTRKQIMLNIDLDDKNMKKQFFKEAVFKCIEKKEQENQKKL